MVNFSAAGGGAAGLTPSPAVPASAVTRAAIGSSVFVSGFGSAARANSELFALPDLLDAVADGAGTAAGASAAGGEDDSLLLIQSGLLPPPKEAVVSVSNMDKPPQPERQVANRTAAMRVRSIMRFRRYGWTSGPTSPKTRHMEKTVKSLISPERCDDCRRSWVKSGWQPGIFVAPSTPQIVAKMARVLAKHAKAAVDVPF